MEPILDDLHHSHVQKKIKIISYHVGSRVKFFFQAEDGIRDSSTSRGLGDVYKRQPWRAVGGWRDVPADGVNPLDTYVYVAMNRFTVLPGKEEAFERRWAERESKLENLSLIHI